MNHILYDSYLQYYLKTQNMQFDIARHLKSESLIRVNHVNNISFVLERSLNENCFSLDSEETQQCCPDNSECTKEENGYNFKYVCKENYDEVHGECENGMFLKHVF